MKRILRMNTAAVTKIKPGSEAGFDFMLNVSKQNNEILRPSSDNYRDWPIALFDSGVGGLTVARHVRAALPCADLMYFADCGWAPYGPRAPQDIVARVVCIARWLVAQRARALVVACNTATTLAIGTLRAQFPRLPIIGVEPGVQPAIRHTRSGVVGILATHATLQSPWFRALLARQPAAIEFVCQAGHGLVELIEQGRADSAEVDALLARYLLPMCERGADTLVLGSTHFPLLAGAIQRCVGARLHLIDTGPAVANRVADVVGPAGRDGQGRCRVYTSAPSEALDALAAELLGAGNAPVPALTDTARHL